MNNIVNPKKYHMEFETKQEELDLTNKRWLNRYKTPPNKEETLVGQPWDLIVKCIMPNEQQATEDILYKQQKPLRIYYCLGRVSQTMRSIST